jgi:hypothetical protein
MDAPPLHDRTFPRTLPHKCGRRRVAIGMGLAHHCLYLMFTVTSFLQFVNTQKWWAVNSIGVLELGLVICDPIVYAPIRFLVGASLDPQPAIFALKMRVAIVQLGKLGYSYTCA